MENRNFGQINLAITNAAYVLIFKMSNGVDNFA